MFEVRFGAVSPSVRDQAFSFDAACCLLQAYTVAIETTGTPRAQSSEKYRKLDNDLLDTLNAQLRKELCNGITGDIRFQGTIGQNVGSRLNYTKYEPISKTWSVVDYRDLFR